MTIIHLHRSPDATAWVAHSQRRCWYASSRSEIMRLLHRDLWFFRVVGIEMDLPNGQPDGSPDDGDRDPATGTVYGEPT